jgi:hypothetical protein
MWVDVAPSEAGLLAPIVSLSVLLMIQAAALRASLAMAKCFAGAITVNGLKNSLPISHSSSSRRIRFFLEPDLIL